MRLKKQAFVVAMAERGLDKSSLAREMGLSRWSIYRHLDGNPCKPQTAKKYADVLGKPVGELFMSELELEG